jgi:hypothetical protein
MGFPRWRLLKPTMRHSSAAGKAAGAVGLLNEDAAVLGQHCPDGVFFAHSRGFPVCWRAAQKSA